MRGISEKGLRHFRNELRGAYDNPAHDKHDEKQIAKLPLAEKAQLNDRMFPCQLPRHEYDER